MLEERLAFLVELGVLADTEIGQVVGQQTLTSTVQDPLGPLLQQLQGIDWLLVSGTIRMDDN